MPARVETDHQFSHHLKLISSATAPKLISRSMSPLLANMVLSFCKTIQQYSSAGVLGCFFGVAHTPVRFGRPIVARTTAVSSSVRTMERPTVRSPRSPLGQLHDGTTSAPLVGCRVRASVSTTSAPLSQAAASLQFPSVSSTTSTSLTLMRWIMEIYGVASESVPLSLPSCTLPRSASSLPPLSFLHREPKDLAYSLPPSVRQLSRPSLSRAEQVVSRSGIQKHS
jgi:hypothetical protein